MRGYCAGEWPAHQQQHRLTGKPLGVAWFFDLHFASSRRKFLQNGHAQKLLRHLPDTAPQAPARDYLLGILDAAQRSQ
jgi:hypothetical protein